MTDRKVFVFVFVFEILMYVFDPKSVINIYTLYQKLGFFVLQQVVSNGGI